MFATATQEKLGRGSGKNAGEWTGRVEINKEEIPGSKRSMHGNRLTYSRFYRDNLSVLCSHKMGLQFLHPELPTAGY